MEAEFKSLYKQVGALIASHRRGKYTQTELAEKLDLSRASIANIERGEQSVQLHFLFKIAALLQIPPDSLIPDAVRIEDSRGTLRDAKMLALIKARRTSESVGGVQ